MPPKSHGWRTSLAAIASFRKASLGSALFLVLALFLGVFSPPALAQSVSQPTVDIKDVDEDGVPDATLNSDKLRVIISSKNGNISLYYVKGQNFEENLYPPILANYGYTFASSTMAPFETLLGNQSAEQGALPTFTLNRDTNGPADKIVINAVANEPIKGLSLVKRYTFPLSGYSFSLDLILYNNLSEEVVLGNAQLGTPGLTIRFGPGLFLDPFNPCSVLGLKPGIQEVYDTPEKFQKGTQGGGYTGIGLKTTYFCALIEASGTLTFKTQTTEVKATDPKKKVFTGDVIECSLPPFPMKPQETKTLTFRNYFGPKLLDELKLIQREQVTDYGFLSTLLLRILQSFNYIYPNYGMSIIFLTLIVRASLYPLTISQTKSMAKMQKIQPMVQDIKDRYKDDPQKFNEEVLKLYQKHQVNPLGGCLPLFLQLPVLIALYNTINIAVELRKVPFLWMPDLTKSDPYMILPIAIAALMYYQQGKMTDPQQQQMMAFMPMFMFIITWSLPSGLLVYWFISSVIGVFQQIQANQLSSASKEEKIPR